MARKDFGCGREECSASTGIDESVTFGTGRLDPNGFWEFPCRACEKAWYDEEKEREYNVIAQRDYEREEYKRCDEEDRELEEN